MGGTGVMNAMGGVIGMGCSLGAIEGSSSGTPLESAVAAACAKTCGDDGMDLA